MRDSIHLFVNGSAHRVSGSRAWWTLSDFLRNELGLVGTKIVCSEGDCGACTVLLGKPSLESRSVCSGKISVRPLLPGTGPAGASHKRGRTLFSRPCLTYQVVDSCIVFLHQLDRTHVVSVEGLEGSEHLSAVQRAMVQCHGSQCGYCTPGFVVAMHAMFEQDAESEPDDRGGGDHTGLGSCEGSPLSEDCWRVGLSGNLCRCTGYVQIIEAGQSIDPADVARMNQRYPAERILRSFEQLDDVPIKIDRDGDTIFVPTTLDEAVAFKADHPQARVVTGATDIGVQHNHGRDVGQLILCLNNVPELTRIVCNSESLEIGASATWTNILQHARQLFPELADVLLRFGSPQIRNFGTIGGNLANASPIADSIPFLYVIDAKLRLTSVCGSREVSANDFYRGYKQMDLRSNELIESIRCPLLKPNQYIKLYKVSKRRDMDISTFTAAFWLEIQDDIITDARIALGGVGPTVLRVPKAEESLVGIPFSLAAMQQAGSIARLEIKPISDVRGSKQYRSQVAENIFAKCFYDLAPSVGLSEYEETVSS